MRLLDVLFRRRQVTPKDVLDRLDSVESRLRTYQTEQVTMHDEVRRWMRRAVAAERRVEAAEKRADATREATPAADQGSVASAFRGRGMISRIRAAQRVTRPDPLDDPERVHVEEPNGVHP